MRNYAYRAHNLAGRIVEGTVRANDKKDAYELLVQDQLVPVDIRPAVESAEGRATRLFGERIKVENVMLFTRQLSAMIKSGIPIVQIIKILRDQTENKAFRQVLAGVDRALLGGSSLSEALAQYPRVFSSQYVSIVVSGESGGDLVKALSSMAQWMEHEMEVRAAIKSALRYPVMVCIALAAAAVVMLTFVIPRVTFFFEGTDVPLPLPTRILLAGSNIFKNYWHVGLVMAVLAVAGWVFLLKQKPVRLQFDKMKFHIRLFGPLYTKIVVARFGRIFAMLIRNGVPVLRAVEAASTVVTNAFFQKLLGNVRQFIQDGNTIADGFINEMPIFPSMVTSLIAVGEKTGSLDDMLDLAVEFYESDIDYTLRHLTAMIEPIITVAIGAAALFLALSIFLPIWNMSQALTGQAP